jgi:UrcA family protein
MSLKAKIVLCSVGVSLMASTALYAADMSRDETQHSVRVRYTDLNLQRHSDVARLYRRLNIAAQSVCGPRDFGGYRAPGYDSCIANTVRQAVAAVDSAALTEFYEGKVSVAQSGREIALSR